MLIIPESALRFGFINPPGGTHTSRTIMLAELRLLLAAEPPDTALEAYRTAIVEDNILLKDTQSTRVRTLRGLRELYALDPNVPIFGALRDLWADDQQAQPLLALLSATARDPLLRASTGLVLATPKGETVTPQMLAAAVGEASAGQYNPTVLAKVGRNAASSWQQSGHLCGRVTKIRGQAESRPAAVAYALLLGHLCGASGDALFDTLWSRLLDAPTHVLRNQAQVAAQQGWIEYRQSGGVTEVGFRYLLRAEEGMNQP